MSYLKPDRYKAVNLEVRGEVSIERLPYKHALQLQAPFTMVMITDSARNGSFIDSLHNNPVERIRSDAVHGKNRPPAVYELVNAKRRRTNSANAFETIYLLENPGKTVSETIIEMGGHRNQDLSIEAVIYIRHPKTDGFRSFERLFTTPSTTAIAIALPMTDQFRDSENSSLVPFDPFKDATRKSLMESGALFKNFYATQESALEILDSTLSDRSRPLKMPQSLPSTNLAKTGFDNLKFANTQYQMKESSKSSDFSDGFSHSSKNIWIDEYAMLHADCKRKIGNVYSHSTLRLNDFIGNDNGYFTVEYEGIVASALSFKIAEDGHTLTAEVRDLVNDTYNIRTLDLDACVANIDGRLVFRANHSGRL